MWMSCKLSANRENYSHVKVLVQLQKYARFASLNPVQNANDRRDKEWRGIQIKPYKTLRKNLKLKHKYLL